MEKTSGGRDRERGRENRATDSPVANSAEEVAFCATAVVARARRGRAKRIVVV